MNLREILAAKGVAIITIGPEATLREAAQRLVENRVGAMLVVPQGSDGRLASQLLGIISERDVLRICAAGTSLDKTCVAEVMSTQLTLGSPHDELDQVMGVMTSGRKRHLPVVSDGRVEGIVSIGDIVKAQHDLLAVENRFMKDYIRS
jgi:CBS domain-containing protein